MKYMESIRLGRVNEYSWFLELSVRNENEEAKIGNVWLVNQVVEEPITRLDDKLPHLQESNGTVPVAMELGK